jgi:sirohydrochlorin cobaltochelatase
MWDSFCALALDGGPPHRGTMLEPPAVVDAAGEQYRWVVGEIARGVEEVAGLVAEAAEPGWMRIVCESAAQAGWLAEAIRGENVAARHEGRDLFVPVAEQFTVKGEIKNVITAVAKTTHYWDEHLAAEVKQVLATQAMVGRLVAWLKGFWKR